MRARSVKDGSYGRGFTDDELKVKLVPGPGGIVLLQTSN